MASNTVSGQKDVLKELFSSGKPYSIVYVGLTGMQEAIEDFGSELAPRLIDAVSRRVQHCVRGDDSAIAVSNDQFALVIQGTYSTDVLSGLEERIRSTIEKDVVFDGKKASLIVDFGTAAFPADGAGFKEVMAHACSAMERAQRSRERFDALASESEGIVVTSANDVHTVHVDPLTGLPGSQYFRKRVAELAEGSHDGDDDRVIVFCDIEKFKEYNLKFGYNSGDDLLKYMADLLEEFFPGDLVARMNSDRFGIFTLSEGVEAKLKEVHDKLRLFKVNSRIEFKAGICSLADSGFNTTKAQDYALLACDSIKGRFDRVWRRFDDTLSAEVRRRQYIIDNLDRAIEQDWVEVFYQPIVRSMTGDICSMEALCRWNDPEFGVLPPGEFIDVLEDAHLIHKLDLCVVRKVCSAGKAVIDEKKDCVSRSINLSRLDYQLCDIFTLVDEIVEASGFPRNKLDIEFTESAFAQDTEFFAGVIDKFRSAGYGVWMDDFGSGYSSLNLLKDFRFDMLKIDMGFLRGIEDDQRTRDIVSSVVDMAKKLGIQTLAEGVETEQQYRFLRSIGCEMLQGYLFCRPMRIDDLDKRIEAGELRAESDSDAVYYDTIGQVNLLSPAPFEQAEERLDSLEFSSGIPLAIAERLGNEAGIIVANDAFRAAAFETGVIQSLDDKVIEYSSRGNALIGDLITLADKAKETGMEESLDFYNFKELFTLRLMYLASNGPREAYLVSLNKYDTVTELQRSQQRRDKSPDLIYLPESQVTPWQSGTEFDVDKTALIVIDVLGGSEGITPGLEMMAANCVAIVKAARAAGMPVIFNNDAHIKGIDRELELWGDHGVRGTESGTPLAEFEVCDTDFIIPKRRYNGFFETDLELTLRELGITTLIMVGADTNICVLQTLAGAYFFGYKTIVPADATATFLVGTQEAGLEYFSRCYDTRIVTTDDLLESIGAGSQDAGAAEESDVEEGSAS